MSSDRIRLEPLGRFLEVAPGTPLADVLFAYGVEFPCGGRGRCRKCRVRVLEGQLAGRDDAQEPDGTWLSCRCRSAGDVTLEIAQWETAILADDSPFDFVPSEGYGVAIDLGTTTLVAQLLDLRTAHVLGVRTALNPQTQHGSDIMSRIEFALHGGADVLRNLIRNQIDELIRELAPPEPPVRTVIVGNTAMHHLYCGVDVAPLAAYPFEPVADGLVELGDGRRFLPCLGGFVGSDILAGILATRMHLSERLNVLLDLGTNGEIVVGNRDRLLCCSTAAGPAFEGGRISMGMRAATGAISEVTAKDGGFACHVLGGGAPRGICGSGLVDAVAVALDLGLVHPNGRFANKVRQMPIAPPVGWSSRIYGSCSWRRRRWRRGWIFCSGAGVRRATMWTGYTWLERSAIISTEGARSGSACCPFRRRRWTRRAIRRCWEPSWRYSTTAISAVCEAWWSTSRSVRTGNFRTGTSTLWSSNRPE
jgi:uncharacterized 2Fe-2S/4Fe-4S cluster protein (DUF4445 family)